MRGKLAALTAALIALSSSVSAQERAGDAALGALSGAVVLGPIGAVAGAVVGYTAGPSIAQSWRLRRSSAGPRYRTPKQVHPTQKRVVRAERQVARTDQVGTNNTPPTSARAAEPASSDKVSLPPPQGFE
jgi:hypothetical protein